MKITDSTIAMAAERQYQRAHAQNLSIRTEAPRTEVSISDEGQRKAAQEVKAVDEQSELEADPKFLLIRQLVEALTGIRIEIKPLALRDPQQAAPATGDVPQAANTTGSEGGAAVEYREVFEESESLRFAASGVIKTADGREISFQAELEMSRYYREEFSVSAASGSLAKEKKDPLVLNYAAAAATLSKQTFSFDVDADGTADTISQLGAGSAYLALDLNQDGKINDGRELFGTQSGDGFADLAKFDEDKNGWIDEGDTVFAKLKLWIKDTNGQDQLVKLADQGIGAIYLGRTRGDFSLTDSQNQELGQIRATGLYLNEDGSTGTVQQIDLVV